MMNELQSAIDAVKLGNFSFCKFITANDAGTTGAHQAGLYIPKNSVPLIFDSVGVKGQNKERFAEIIWYGKNPIQCCFKYYGVGSRNEYRITRLGVSFKEGELVVIVKVDEISYLGFRLFSEIDINLFLETFDLARNETNSLIVYENEFQEVFEEEEDFSFDEDLPESRSNETKSMKFKPKAHILTLLGEELIKDPVMAIYELVKNSYDADAGKVDVYFRNITELDIATIIVRDNGLGMTDDVLTNVWLEPGTAFRKPFDDNGIRQIVRSSIFNRTPMGEKGVGRFAVHKLGSNIKLISRPAKINFNEDGTYSSKELLNYEIVVDINWKAFTQSKYLSDVNIVYKKNTDPESFYFKEGSGTYIKVSDLKEIWNRGMARQLKRQTLSMVSPKNDAQKFSIDLNFNNNWLDKFPDVDDLLFQAPYKLQVIINKDFDLSFEYKFRLANNTAIGERQILKDSAYDKNVREEIKPLLRKYYGDKGFENELLEEKLQEKLKEQLPFGGLMLELYSYDLDSGSLRDVTYTPDILKKTLKELHGVKVFKNDLRVYDYGEVGNDWLGLDSKRVNNKEWFSNNQNIGYVYLDSAGSQSLIEKTNREGFISNESFDLFKIVLEFILSAFKVERQKDRLKWLNFNKKSAGVSFERRIASFVDLINEAEIGNEDKRQELLLEAGRIEDEYEKAQETLLIPAGVGMTASVALHEIEKLVPRMEHTVNEYPLDNLKIRDQVEELDEYVSGILSVLKQSGSRPVSIKDAIDSAVANYRLKTRIRNINVKVTIQDGVETIRCDKRYLVTMLMNLIDNSIYWLDTIYREDKTILVNASLKNGITSILIADNGPGFRDSVQEIVTPFFSRKDGGIGIGMYLIDTIMLKYGKFNIYLDNSAADVEPFYSGAIVELIFNKNQDI